MATLVAGVVGAIIAVVIWIVAQGLASGRRRTVGTARSTDENVVSALASREVENGRFVVQVDRLPEAHRVLWRIDQPPTQIVDVQVTIDNQRTDITIPTGTPIADLPALINRGQARFSAAPQPGGIELTSRSVGSVGRMNVVGIDAAHLTDQNGDRLDANVRVNGHALQTTNDFLTVRPHVQAQIKSAGTAEIICGPDAGSVLGSWPLSLLRRPPSGPTLLYRTLRWQLWAGVLLVVVGGVGGMYYGTNQGSVNAQSRALGSLPGATTTSVPTTTTTNTNLKGTTTTSTTTTTTTTLGSTTTSSSTTAREAPSGAQTPVTPGGTTSSTVSLVQAIALAMVAAGATMIPTGASGVLAAKVKTEE